MASGLQIMQMYLFINTYSNMNKNNWIVHK